MDKNKQFAIFVVILLLLGAAGIKRGYYSSKKESVQKLEIKKISSSNSLKKGKIDINSVEIKDIIGDGINYGVAEKIIAYREKTGAIKSLDELKVLKGVGSKRYIKLKERFYIDENSSLNKKKVNINSLNEEELEWFGFNKKEIKKTLLWKQEHGKIGSNLELLEIVGESRYKQLKEQFTYQNY